MNDVWKRLVERTCPHSRGLALYCGECQAEVEVEIAREREREQLKEDTQAKERLMWKKWKSRRKRRRQQATDILRLSPEKCAQLLRSFERVGVGDIKTRLALAQRAQLSENPGEAESMARYEEVIRAGRRVRYGTFSAQFRTVQVDPDLRAAVEDAFRGEEKT